jgi:excisionase family DNA binding protein
VSTTDLSNFIPCISLIAEDRRPLDESSSREAEARSSHSPSNELPDVMTVPELAAFLRISEKSVYALISGKRITHVRVLSCVRFLKTDVLRYMQENRVSASEE